MKNKLIKEIKKNKYTSIAVVAFIALLLLLFIIYKAVMPSLGTPVYGNRLEGIEKVEITTNKMNELDKKLEKEKYVSSSKTNVSGKTVEEHSDKIDKDLVISTNPKEGKSVKEGTEVTLTVSLGKELVKIENYVGQNYIEVKTKLELLGLKVTIEETSGDSSSLSTEEKQQITKQSIEEGEEVNKGDEIILYIPSSKEYYPDMTGEKWTLGEARTWASNHGVKLTVKYKEMDGELGIVVSQSKTSKTVIKSGDTLVVTISKEKQVTTKDNSNNNSDANTKEDDTTTDKVVTED